MGNYITLGNIDKKYIFILFFLIVINILTTLYDIYVDSDKYKNSRTMSVTIKHIGLSLCFIPESIRRKNSIVKNNSKFELKLKNLSFIIMISFIYLIHDFAFIFSDRYIVEKDNKKQLKLKGNFFYAFLLLFLMSIFIFKKNYYKHQYISVVLIICLGIIRYFAKFIDSYNSEIKSDDIIIEILFHISIYSCLSLYISFSQKFMEKYFVSPWETSCIVGLFNLSSNLILYFIFSFIQCKKNTFCSLEYKNNYYIDNIFSFFSTYSIIEAIMYFLIHLTTSLRYILFNIILQNFTVFHILLSYQMVSFIWNIVDLIESNKKNILVNIIIVITYIFELFINFFFLEFIELNFCGLNINTKKHIIERAAQDNISMSSDSDKLTFEVDNDYVVVYKESNDIESRNKNKISIELKK